MKTPTDQQLNIAMCEWVGWTHITNDGFGMVPDAEEFDSQGALERLYPLPNYLSDDSPRRLLNEAEAKLTENQYYLFRGFLAKIQDNENTGWFSQQCISATACQRVIAILQVVKPELFK